MEHLRYEIDIAAPAKTVWDTMLQEETYKQWVSKAWPDSYYKGSWAKGEKIRFIAPDGSGTLAEIVEFKPFQKVAARHIAMLLKNGKEDSTSDEAKRWVGIIEEYTFKEHNGTTTLTVDMRANPEWRKMFDDGWPTALEELKRITERQFAEV